jgi:hypothetical protein
MSVTNLNPEHVVPAIPGYSVVVIHADATDPEKWSESHTLVPVVAWHCMTSHAMPITPGFIAAPDNAVPYGILCHDGTVFQPVDSLRYTSVKEFVRCSIATMRAGPEAARILTHSVDDLGLSVRARNSVRGEGIHTVLDLVQRTEGELRRTANVGKKSLAEIKEALQRYGLSLGLLLSDDEEADGEA